MTNEEIRMVEDEKSRLYAKSVYSELEQMVMNDMLECDQDTQDFWSERLK